MIVTSQMEVYFVFVSVFTLRLRENRVILWVSWGFRSTVEGVYAHSGRATCTTSRLTVCLLEEPFEPVHVGRTARKKKIVCGAGFCSTLHDGHNTGGLHICRRCPLALQRKSLRGFADVFGIGSKALSGGHYPVDIDREALGAGSTGWDSGLQRHQIGRAACRERV